MVPKHSKESSYVINQGRYMALLDSSAWPFQGERRESWCLSWEGMHCYQGGLLSSSISFFFFCWVNSFIVGNRSVIPASALSNAVERIHDCLSFFLLKLFMSGLISVFQFVSSYSMLYQETGSPPPPCSVCCFYVACDVHSARPVRMEPI